MARARFTGPANPGPDGTELGHTVPLLGRTVLPEELVIDFPGDVVDETADAWVLGDQADADNRYVLPKALWQVEDPPKRAKPRSAASKAEGE